MIGAMLVTSALAYGAAAWWSAQRGRAVSWRAASAWLAGLATIGATLAGPMDDLADASLAWHMVQHLVLVTVAAPLLVLGAPLRLMLAALPPRQASRLAQIAGSHAARFVTQPAFAWLQFTAVLYVSHFSPLYEASLEHEAVHACEHALYLASALIFWTPLLAVAPAPHAPSHPLRLLAAFLALPMSAFLGFAFYVARAAMYPHYAAHPGALADQMRAGAVMWIAGSGPIFVALLWIVADWGARERRYGAIADGRPVS